MRHTINLAGVVLVIAFASLAFTAAAGAATTHASSTRLSAFIGHTGSATAPTSGKSPRSGRDFIFPSEGQNFSGQVGTFTEPCFFVCFPPTVTFDWGDGATDPAPGWVPLDCTIGAIFSPPSCDFAVFSSHTYAEEGVYNTAVNWSQPVVGASGSSPGQAIVFDAPLTAGAGPAITSNEGKVSTAIGSFTDGNVSAAASDFSAIVNWGDGSSSPAAVSGSGGSYTVTGTHTYDESAGTPYAISMVVTDIGSAQTAINGTANVNEVPLSPGTAGLNTTEGAFSGKVATFSDTNTSAPASDFTATIHWGDGSAPTIGTVTGSGGTYAVSGTHTYEDGTYTPFTVTITDDGGASTSMAGTAHVADAALTGTAQSISAFSTVPFSGVLATFKDANPSGKLTDYTASVNWGDGTTGPGVVAANPTGGWQVSGTHTFAAPATLPVKITINDAGGQSTVVTDTAAVGSPPVPVTTITPSPAAPNGNNGWYRTPVNVIVTASGLGSVVQQTRCALDPPAAPGSFDALPGSCPFAGGGANVSGDGVHHLYAASENVSGNKEAPVLSTFNIDTTPPHLACGKQPTFVLGSSGNSVPATVSDATSGPASSTVSGPAAVSSVGIHSVNLTGFDNAGNSATVSCSYRVLGHINNLLNYSVVPGSRFSRMFSMLALDVPIGSQIKVICTHAKGCPFHAKTIKATSHSKCKGKGCKKHRKPNSVNVDLTGMFGKSHLPNGSQVLIEITKQFEIGKVWILSIRKNAAPASTITCMAPGSSTPGRGC